MPPAGRLRVERAGPFIPTDFRPTQQGPPSARYVLGFIPPARVAPGAGRMAWTLRAILAKCRPPRSTQTANGRDARRSVVDMDASRSRIPIVLALGSGILLGWAWLGLPADADAGRRERPVRGMHRRDRSGAHAVRRQHQVADPARCAVFPGLQGRAAAGHGPHFPHRLGPDAAHRQLRRAGPGRRFQARPGRRRPAAVPDDDRLAGPLQRGMGARCTCSRPRPARWRSTGCRSARNTAGRASRRSSSWSSSVATSGAGGRPPRADGRDAKRRRSRRGSGGRIRAGRARPARRAPCSAARRGLSAVLPPSRDGLGPVGPGVLVIDQPFAAGIEELARSRPGRR